MLIERRRGVINGICHDECDRELRIRLEDPLDTKPQKATPELLSVMALVDSEPSDERGWHRIGQRPTNLRGAYLLETNCMSSDRHISENREPAALPRPSAVIDGYPGSTRVHTRIALVSEATQPIVERLVAASEAGPFVARRVESLDPHGHPSAGSAAETSSRGS